MNKLIVVPARGGSKGIPKKNIYPLNGKPLLNYTLETILQSKLQNTDVVVSTDCDDIKNVASKFSGISIIDRPSQLAEDNTSTEDVLLHALKVMEQQENKKYEAILTLQPTSPLRKVETLCDFVETYEKSCSEFDSLVSLTETRSDFWLCNKHGYFSRLDPQAPRRRQDRKPLYVENSAYYITKVESLRESHSVLGYKPKGYIISEIEGIDINEFIDLKIAEVYIKEV